MICYMLYAHGGGGGKGLETWNEFACGRNGGSASIFVYFSFLHQSHRFTFFRCRPKHLSSFVFFVLFSILYVCMYCTPVTNACSYVENSLKIPIIRPFLFGASPAGRSGGCKQVCLYLYCTCTSMYIHTRTIKGDDLQITAFHL